MCFKKNAFSYVCWGMMILLAAAIVSYWGMVAAQLVFNGNLFVVIAGTAVFFATVYFIYLLTGVIQRYTKVLDSYYINERISAVEEMVVVGILLVFFFAVRIYLLSVMTVDVGYFNIAHITEEGTVATRFAQGSVYYYSMLLHACFKVFGNHLIVGVWLQIILQTISSVLFYMAVRTLGGKVAALFFLIVACFSSTAIDAGLSYSPQMLYLCIFGLVFYLCAIYLQKAGNALNSVKTWIGSVCLGLAIGFVCYVDVTGILLLLLVACICMVKCNVFLSGYRYLHLGAVILSAIIMFFLAVFLDAVLSGAKFGDILNAWLTIYAKLSVNIDAIAKNHSREFIVLPIFISLGIFAFWKRKKEQCFAPFIIMTFGVALLYFLGITDQNMDGSFLLYLLMTALAGISISELFYTPEMSVPKFHTAEDDVDFILNMDENKETVESMPDTVIQDEEVPDTMEEVPFTVNRVENEKETNDMEKRFGRKKEENNMIENPLPVPKKKEKKVMDFAFQPEPFEMMYDIRVSEKDDFDV